MTRKRANVPEAYNNLGVLFLRENKLEDAKKEFQLAIKFNPTYANAHKNLGDTLERLGNIAEARKEWQNQSLSPGSPDKASENRWTSIKAGT